MKMLIKTLRILAVAPLFALSISSSLHADASLASNYPQQTGEAECSTYSCSSNYYEQDCCTNHFDWSGLRLTGDFLYWRIVQDQMQYAAVVPGGIQPIIDAFSNPPVQLAEDLFVSEPHTQYEPGFRIGCVVEIPDYCWDLGLNWTHLDAGSISRVFNAENGVIPITAPATSIFAFLNRDPSMFSFGTGATSRWDFNFNTVDVSLSRECCTPCESISLTPAIGVKIASIKQKQNIEYLGFGVRVDPQSQVITPITIQVNKRNDFYGTGPYIGCSGVWDFLSCWRLIGGVGSSLLFGKFHVSQRPFATLPPNFIGITVHTSKKARARPMVDAFAGIDWSVCNWCGTDVSIALMGEVQYWWNQWQAPGSTVTTVINSSSSPQGDLVMYGLTARLTVRF